MQITLMRHGKPDLAPGQWLAPCDMAHWIAQYDQASVATDAIPPASMAIARLAHIVIASPLPRSQSSAWALGYPAPRVDALFCEAPCRTHAGRFHAFRRSCGPRCFALAGGWATRATLNRSHVCPTARGLRPHS
jgi:hypothetical protein